MILSLPLWVPSVILLILTVSHVEGAGSVSKACLHEGRRAHFKADASRGKRMSYLEHKKVKE